MIKSADEAREIAFQYLKREHEPRIGEPLVVTDVREYPTCWAVDYSTKAWFVDGLISHALAGGGPVIVNRASGRARIGTFDEANMTVIVDE